MKVHVNLLLEACESFMTKVKGGLHLDEDVKF